MIDVRMKLLDTAAQANSLMRDVEEQANAAARRFVQKVKANPYLKVDGVPVICHHGKSKTTMLVVMARPYGGIAVHHNSCCPACECLMARFPIERAVEVARLEDDPDSEWDTSRFLDGPQRIEVAVILGASVSQALTVDVTYDPSQLSLWPSSVYGPRSATRH